MTSAVQQSLTLRNRNIPMSLALALEDDPDGQIPMPFEAAAHYARQVMAWSREVDLSALQVRRGVIYGQHRLQRYDVFAPAGAKDLPVLVFWHGGGWTNGYREYGYFMAPLVCALGIILVTPSYRLVGEAKLPAALDDAQACLQHVIESAPAFGADSGRIVLAGHSAGAHLASLVALRSPAAVAQSIRACLPISGIMDLHHPAPPAGSLEERVYSMVLQNPLHDAVLSPLCWTAGSRIPFDLSIGERDSDRVKLSNRRMHALFETQGVSAQLHVRSGHSHFDTHTCLKNADDPWYERLCEHALRSLT